jgi:hypothetical protein
MKKLTRHNESWFWTIFKARWIFGLIWAIIALIAAGDPNVDGTIKVVLFLSILVVPVFLMRPKSRRRH